VHEKFAMDMASDMGLSSGEWPLRAWSDVIRKINELDSHPIDTMYKVWKQAHSDSFWCDVILSPTNFRKHWQRLKKIKTKQTRGGVVPVGLDELTIYEGTKKPQGFKESL